MKLGWKTVKLTDVAELSGRIGWKGLTAKEYTQAGPYFLSVHSLNYGDFVDFRDAFHISQARYDESPEIMLQAGDVLICKDGAGIGKVGIVGELPGKTTINSSLLLIRATQKIEPRYLYYILMSPYFQAIVQSRLEGATTPHLYQRDIAGFPIHLPPLEEQLRIVAVLDKAFEGIATATANAQKNLTNARALFEGYLESTLNKKGDGWTDVTLGKACKVERGSSPRPIKSFFTTEDDGQNWIKIGDTKNDSKYVTQTKQRITPAGALKSRKVDPGDFILTNSMSFGKPYIMKISGYIHDGWFALRLGEGIDTEFFYYLLSSPIVQKQFQHLAAGAIVLNISGDLVKKAVLPMPPVEQQRDIVSRIQLVDNETNRLAGIYEAKLAAMSELKQSLLQKAFAGELT